MDEPEQFKATIWKQGSSLIITIPRNIVKYAGYKVGDDVKIVMSKDNTNLLLGEQ